MVHTSRPLWSTKRALGCVLCLAAVAFVSPPSAASEDLPARLPLIIHTAQGEVELQVELAATPESRRRGLMFRNKLGHDAGMLFDHQAPKRIAMWMKNTLIPLDMLFIAETGRISKIVANTVPHSLRPISSEIPVQAVLELNGGAAREFGIQQGDMVSHQIFSVNSSSELIGGARVIDGDSLWIGQVKVRLFNIDAPEPDQLCQNPDGKSYACGQLSKNELTILTTGQRIRCVGDQVDDEGFRLGACFLDDMNLNKEMVSRGWAVVYRRKKYDEDYLRIERIAKKQGNGMWRGTFITPWDWRNGVR